MLYICKLSNKLDLNQAIRVFRSSPYYAENIIYFFTKQAVVIRRLTVLSLTLQLVFHGSIDGSAILVGILKTSYDNLMIILKLGEPNL